MPTIQEQQADFLARLAKEGSSGAQAASEKSAELGITPKLIDRPILTGGTTGGAGTALAAPAAVNVGDVREEERKRVQSLIDAINREFDARLSQETQVQTGREARTRALNIRGGLAGSDFASAAAVETEQFGKQQRAAIESERTARVESALQRADDRAVQIAQLMQTKNQQDFENAIILRGKALEDLSLAAERGTTFDQLAPEFVESLRNAGISDDSIKGALIKGMPQDQILGSQVVDNIAYFFTKNPRTGQISTQSITLPKSGTGSKFLGKSGNALIFGPDKITSKDDLIIFETAPSDLETRKTEAEIAELEAETAKTRRETEGGAGSEAAAIVNDLAREYAAAATATERSSVITRAKNLGVNEAAVVKAALAIPPTVGQIVSKVTGRPIKLSDAVNKLIVDWQSFTRDSLPRIQQMLDSGDINTGFLKGRKVATLPAGMLSEADNKFNTLISNFNSMLFLLRSGAAVTPSEEQRLSGALPSFEVSNEKNVARIEEFKKTGEEIMKRTLDVHGAKIAGEEVEDEVDVISPDGVPGTVPASQLDEALSEGYQLAE